jgi:hypothetical protein
MEAVMFKYVLIDLNNTEIFDTEDEAREGANMWLSDAICEATNSIRNASEKTISRWERDESYYVGRDSIELEIRIYKVDTDIFDEDLEEVGDGDCGVERIATFHTDIHSLFSDSELEELNDYYKEDEEDSEDEED